MYCIFNRKGYMQKMCGVFILIDNTWKGKINRLLTDETDDMINTNLNLE